MRIILLAGYRKAATEDCPWLTKEAGLAVLERRIRESFRYGKECVVVLGGETADDALRLCPSLEKCELVFDTSENLNLLSNLKAALKTGADPALVLPAELSFGDPAAVQRLIGWAAQQGVRAPAHFFQIAETSGYLVNQGFPLILTLRGAQEILRNTTITGLADLQLSREPVSPLPQP